MKGKPLFRVCVSAAIFVVPFLLGLCFSPESRATLGAFTTHQTFGNALEFMISRGVLITWLIFLGLAYLGWKDETKNLYTKLAEEEKRSQRLEEECNTLRSTAHELIDLSRDVLAQRIENNKESEENPN